MNAKVVIVTRESARDWSAGKIPDDLLVETSERGFAFVTDVEGLSDLTDAFWRFSRFYSHRATGVIFRAHAPGIDSLARHVGMSSVIEDIGGDDAKALRITGKRYFGDVYSLANIVCKFRLLVTRKLKQHERNHHANNWNHSRNGVIRTNP